MNFKFYLSFGLGLFLLSFSLFAAIDVYEFKDEEKQQRFQKLTAELRCPKCQNQNLIDSNAEIAKDLRTKIYQMLDEGKSDDSIVEYMLERYGEFVLYEPRLSAQTFLLWYAPIILLITGILIVAFIARYRIKKGNPTIVNIESSLNQSQRQKLSNLLKTEQENK